MYENELDGRGVSEFLVAEPIVSFPMLRYLDLSFNPIRQLSEVERNGEQVSTESLREGGPLSAFPNLEYLYFVETKMTKVPCMKNNTNLRSLELGGNRIRDIEGVEHLTELKELWLGKNKIVTIQVSYIKGIL